MANFPSKVDVLIVGTGLYEAMLSASLSCVGCKVLHIDSNSFYGDLWSSFSFTNIQDLVENKTSPYLFDIIKPPNSEECFANKSESYIKFVDDYMNISDIKVVAREEEAMSSINHDLNSDVIFDKLNNVSDLISQNRHFNIDISPKLLLGGSYMVDILLKSTASKYLEFQKVTSLLSILTNKLTQVPCSRSQIFKSNKITLKEKRLLMKFITFVIAQAQQKTNSKTSDDNTTPCISTNYDNMNFGRFLDSFDLTPTLKHYVIHTVARHRENDPATEGIQKTGKFIEGLAAFHKYATSETTELKTPYLFPLYGSGELPQAFCRLSAVYGAIYMLNIRLDGIVVNMGPSQSRNPDQPTKKAIAAIINGQRVEFDHLVVPGKFAHYLIDDMPKIEKYSRAIFVTDFSLAASTSDQTERQDEISYLHSFSTQDGGYPFEINLLELSSVTNCVPAKYHLYHVSCPSCLTSPRHTLEPIIKQIINSANTGKLPFISKRLPDVKEPIWTLYFAVDVPLPFDLNEKYVKSVWNNVTICPGPDHEFVYSDKSFEDVQSIFEEIATNILGRDGNLSVDLKDNDRNLFRYDISKSSLSHGSGDCD